MFRLFRLQRKLERLDEESRQKALLLHSRPTTQDEWDAFSVPAWKNIRLVQDEIERLQSKQLLRAANRLGLPIPELGDDPAWTSGIEQKFGKHLTVETQAKLRQAIRQERKERRGGLWW